MSKELDSRLLLYEVKQLIEQSKQQVAITVNAALTLLYWEVGKRINSEILQHHRAEYGKRIITTLAKQLTTEFGSGWSEKQLRHCMRFSEAFTDNQIVSTMSRQFSWSHIQSLIYIYDPLKRDFYIEICKLEKWSVRTLRERIQSMLYERTAISKKPDETIKNDLELLRNEQQLSPDKLHQAIIIAQNKLNSI